MRRRPLCKTLIIVEQVGAQGWQEVAEEGGGTCRRQKASGRGEGLFSVWHRQRCQRRQKEMKI